MFATFPSFVTGHQQVDRAFRIAIGDLYGNVVPFQGGLLEEVQPCILAGLDYDTPWTRDAAINVWNGAGLLIPTIARNTLCSVLERRGDRLFIGGQYWDAIVWATGAWAYYCYTADQDFLRLALNATRNSLAFLEETEFDRQTGLFRGGSLFNDGVSGYPATYAHTIEHSSCILDWPAAHPDTRSYPGYGLPMQALSTNCLYHHAYLIAEHMAAALNEVPDPAWAQKAASLKQAINNQLWDSRTARYRYLMDPFGGCDRQEGAGWALAILLGIADAAQCESLFQNAYVAPAGMPCLWLSYERYCGPDGTDVGRHSGTVWPFVQAFWAEACARHGKLGAFTHEFFTLAASACRDRQFAEIYHPITTERYGGLQEWGSAEPILWPSFDRQTWSATGFIRMILLGLIGTEYNIDGLYFHPAMPTGLERAALMGLLYRGMRLNIVIEGRGCRVRSCMVNGQRQAHTFVRGNGRGTKDIVITLDE